jgi:hypothetical protein
MELRGNATNRWVDLTFGKSGSRPLDRQPFAGIPYGRERC